MVIGRVGIDVTPEIERDGLGCGGSYQATCQFLRKGLKNPRSGPIGDMLWHFGKAPGAIGKGGGSIALSTVTDSGSTDPE
jgi:hypothetical protein